MEKKVEKTMVQNHDPKNHDQIHEQFNLKVRNDARA